MAYTSAPVLLIFLIGSIFTFSFCVAPIHALNIGLHADAGLSLVSSTQIIEFIILNGVINRNIEVLNLYYTA